MGVSVTEVWVRMNRRRAIAVIGSRSSAGFVSGAMRSTASFWVPVATRTSPKSWSVGRRSHRRLEAAIDQSRFGCRLVPPQCRALLFGDVANTLTGLGHMSHIVASRSIDFCFVVPAGGQLADAHAEHRYSEQGAGDPRHGGVAPPPRPAYMNAIAPIPASIGRTMRICPRPRGGVCGSSGGDSSTISPLGTSGPAWRRGLRNTTVPISHLLTRGTARGRVITGGILGILLAAPANGSWNGALSRGGERWTSWLGCAKSQYELRDPQ